MKRRKVKVGKGLPPVEAPVEALIDYVSELGRLDMLRFRVLLCVAKRPGQYAAELARELGVDEATMCHLVRSMSDVGDYRRPHMAQKVLRREEGLDRRQRLLYVADRGEELLSWLRDELINLTTRRA